MTEVKDSSRTFLADRQSIEWGVDPFNIGLHRGEATLTGVLYYEVIGAVLGFVVGSWVVLGRFRRREVLLEVLLLTSVLEQC